ncbi:NAD-P-binding protein [Trametes versicolor FP-101664 SS1]|uniref:NAD-P-binding protein n=1 Tax=Trametes versicolor (strain FP-101664) TaxID=717944 RepID=UPI0004623CB6|nr:NAD-P-binding protein [Trametes versicolor FP-101664 SS1]EIW54617.1 NAD-P-binding protein [Trametes versicolor FP-101664 SS1]
MSSTTTQTSWFITGTSRGIGLELVRQLVQSPSNLVVATCRNPEKATALAALKSDAKGTLHIIPLDVSSFDDVRALPKQLEPILGETGLDYLVNNAAMAVWDTAFTMDPDALLATIRTNTAAPALISQVVLPFLERGRAKKILHITSTGGSIGSVDSDRMQDQYRKVTSYAMSKTALNMLAYKQKVERPDLVVITMCPGWVKTDMGGSDAALQPEESISGILKVITSATSADSGKYLSYNGDEIPW